MQVFKYILQYLRARRDSKAFSLPASLDSERAAAVADEAAFLGLPELQTASIRGTVEYEYDFKEYYDHDRGIVNFPGVVKSGWELVSVTPLVSGSRMGFITTRQLVICRRLKP